MSTYILPVLFLILLCFAYRKKINAYGTFINGAKGAFALILDIFPYIATIMIAVGLLRASGITDFLANILSPVFGFLGIPTELCELVLLRPFTGAGSYGLLQSVLATYGADSYISRCACVIMGCSETIFYVATVYFSKTSVKRLLYAIPVALVTSFVGVVLACFLCRFI